MLARRIFVLVLATILLGRTLHCCYTNATLCAATNSAGDAQSPPLRDPADMDPNETGCICKGVVVNTPPVLAALREALDEANVLADCLQSTPGAVAVAATEVRSADRHLLGPPPLGGRALRAWLGRLLV